MKKIFGLALLIMLCSISGFAADNIYYFNSENCTISGEQSKTDFIGYNGTEVISVPASSENIISWKVKLEEAKYYRVFVWKAMSEEGSRDAIVAYTSETQQKTEHLINMQNGNAGWYEIGCYNMMGAGSTLQIYGSTGELLINAIKYEKVGDEYKSIVNINTADDSAIILKVGSFNAYTGGIAAKIPDAAPEVINSRTLVPIRFISEAMGANVEWNGEANEAIINIDGKSLVFRVDDTTYSVDGVAKQLDQPATIVNDRLMLPLRILSEEIGRKVFWDDSGVIIVSKNDVSSIVNDQIVKNINKILGD